MTARPTHPRRLLPVAFGLALAAAALALHGVAPSGLAPSGVAPRPARAHAPEAAPGPSSPNPPPVAADEHPLDLLLRVYAPLCIPGDDLSFPMKVLAASESPTRFSTSTRELFYRWAATACADWLADPGNYVQCHGDVHLGNTGSYVADHRSARLALGLKDFDDTAFMPFQIDLLQALVSLRHIARDRRVELTADDTDALAADLLAHYRTTLATGLSPSELFLGDPYVGGLLKTPTVPLRQTVDAWTAAGRFKPAIVSRAGRLSNLFRPLLREHDPERGVTDKPALAAALARAVAVSPSLQAVLAYATADQFEAAIDDAVHRVRLGSGGSQGLYKIVVLLRAGFNTLDGGTSDVLVYLKQQSDRSAAQRAGFIPPTDLPGGRRVAGGAAALTSPPLDAHGWCNLTLGGLERSFHVTLRNPWEDEPSENLNSLDRLLWAARYLGTLLGAAHRNAAESPDAAERLADRVTSTLRRQLIDRSAAFVTENQRLYDQFIADSRTDELRRRAQTALEAHTPR